jgi:hypothetical protein
LTDKPDRSWHNPFIISTTMKIKMLFVSAIAALMASAIAPQVAKAEILILITSDEGMWSLDAPDADTTASAYGGRLRLYDVHIAKMVEVTHQQCIASRMASRSTGENGSRAETYYWSYRADYGRADMGNFRITCELAQSLATTYGLGEPSPMTVRGEVASTVMGYRTTMIPILHITGEEIDEWVNFTSNFKPWQGREN